MTTVFTYLKGLSEAAGREVWLHLRREMEQVPGEVASLCHQKQVFRRG